MKTTKYYTTVGNSEYTDDDGFYRIDNDSDKVFAKAVKEVKSKNILQKSPNYYKYYVRTDSGKNLYDPAVSHSIKNNRVSFLDKIKNNGSSFMEVNQSVFNKYINYLRTEHSQWLTEAKRELK